MENFELNGKTYRTDTDTYNTVMSVVAAYSPKGLAVKAIMDLGIRTGLIKEL